MLETGFRILEDWAWGITLDSLEIEKERGVVIEEWRLGQGAASRLQNRQFPVLTRNSRYAQRLPIGTYESLRTFRHSALRRFYRDWYRPDLMAVVAVGDFDGERVEALIREHFGRIPAPRRARARREYRVPEHRETLVSVATDPEAPGATVSLYLKKAPISWETVEVYRSWLVESLASSMLINRLSEVMQRPDSPLLDVSSFHGRFIRPLSALVLTGRVHEDRMEAGLDAILTEVERAARHGFTETEMQREKLELLRMMEQRYAEREKTSSGSYAADYISHFLYGGTVLDVADEYSLHARLLPGIGLREVNERVRTWQQERNRVVLARAPARPGLDVPGERRLRQVIDAVGRRSLEAYDDLVSAAPLVRDPPAPGAVVSERDLPGVDVTEWVLSNGARVLLKRTDFREDEILMVARSPGGSSLLPDEDHVAALTAPPSGSRPRGSRYA